MCRCNKNLRIYTDAGIKQFHMQEVKVLKEQWYKEFLDYHECDESDKYFQRYRKEIEEFASKCKCDDWQAPKQLFAVD